MRKGKRSEDNKVEYGTISLPMPLIKRVKQRIKGTGMNSVSAYVSYVLRQILSSPRTEEILDKESEEDVKKRLKSLGYL